MKSEHDRLRLIQGGVTGEKPKRKRKGMPLRCHKCESNRFREVILGPLTDGTRTWGGTKQLRCDECGEPYSAR